MELQEEDHFDMNHHRYRKKASALNIFSYNSE